MVLLVITDALRRSRLLLADRLYGLAYLFDQSTLTPVDLTMSDHLRVSAATKAAKSCGDMVRGSKPSLVMLALSSGARRISFTSVLSRLTMAAGVPAGASRPLQNCSG